MSFRISELTAGTPPYAGTALLELSVPNPGAPSGYDSRKALLSDIAAMVGDGLIVTDGELQGITMLPDGGQISATGQLGIKAVPVADLTVGTTAGSAVTQNLNTGGTNWERAYLGDWSLTPNVAVYGTGQGGTGIARDVQVQRGGVEVMRFGANGVGIGTGNPLAALHMTRTPANGGGHVFIRQDAYRVGSTWYNSGILLGAPRSDTADGSAGAGRGIISLPGNSVDVQTSLFLATQTASLTPGHDVTQLRAASSIELHSAGRVDLWRAGANYARILQNGASWINSASTHLTGIGNDTPTATLSVGKTAASAYTSNLATDGSNYERALIGDWSSNVARYGTTMAGTGVARDVSLVRGGIEQIRLGSGGATFSVALIQKPPATITPANNGELTVEATSNTQLTFRFKGSDGTVRSNTITLA